MAQVFQPSGQIKLTNVAIVRYKSQGKKFELACYSNTINDYRKGLIKDTDEVLQIAHIFVNVSKGQTANNALLKAGFGSLSKAEIVKLILDKGEIQESELERQHEMEMKRKEMVDWITNNTIDTQRGLPFTAGLIEKMLVECHFNMLPKKAAKPNALEAIKQIQAKGFKIERRKLQYNLNLTQGDPESIKLLIEEKKLADVKLNQNTLSLSVEPKHMQELQQLMIPYGTLTDAS